MINGSRGINLVGIVVIIVMSLLANLLKKKTKAVRLQ